MKLLFIFLGGGVGSALRYLLGLFLGPFTAGHILLTTFVCNILGCFLIGVFSAMVPRMEWSEETRLLLTVGLCGGFTTFSTFSRESLGLLEGGHFVGFASYVVASLVIGLAAVWWGMRF